MLTVHHLQISQSERIVFLLEEMGVPYKLVTHPRRSDSGLAPAAIKELNEAGTAPVIVDENEKGERIVIGESSAIVEYILKIYGKGKSSLEVQPGAPNYPQYLEWLHYANGTLQAAMSRAMTLGMAFGGDSEEGKKKADENPIVKYMLEKPINCMARLDKRLSQVPYLAGNELTAADCMSVFSLTTMRGLYPIDLTPFPNLLAYLERIGQRKGYKSAMQKGDPELTPLLAAKVDPIRLVKK